MILSNKLNTRIVNLKGMEKWIKTTFCLGIGFLCAAEAVQGQNSGSQSSSTKGKSKVYTPAGLRSLKNIEENHFYLEDGSRSGLFELKPGAVARDDSALVIRVGGKTYERVIESGIKPEFFGARGDRQTDDTHAIQKAIDAAVERSLPVVFQGSYRLRKKGERTNAWAKKSESYCLVVEGAQNLKLSFDVKTEFILDDKDTPSTLLSIKNSSNITVEGLKGSSSSILKRSLYNGALISIEDCQNITIRGAYSRDLMHGVIAFRSKRVIISNCHVEKKEELSTGTHIGLYACQNSIIENCYTYGGSTDGDIGIFGSPSVNNRISGCFLFNNTRADADKRLSTYRNTSAQGIYVDSGAENTVVTHNYAEGYFYGIDIKTNVTRTLVSSNIVKNCVVGLAARRGEGNQALSNVIFAQNHIIPNGGNGRALKNWISDVPLGILLEDCYGASVLGNTLENSQISGTKDFIGLLIVTTANSNVNRLRHSPIVVSHNRFILESIISDKAGRSFAPSIVLRGGKGNPLLDVNITGNTFDPVFNSSKNNRGVIVAGNTENLSIQGNTFSDCRGTYSISLKQCRNTKISNNHWSIHRGLVKATDCSGMSFSNNTSSENVHESGAATLLLQNVNNVSITANTVARTENGKTSEKFIEATGKSDHFLITNNLLQISAGGKAVQWYNLSGKNNHIDSNLVY